MDRVLQTVPADLRMKMEALVQDLTNALEESSRSTVRRRWGLRRRARSTGNIPASCHKTQSDDSSSSIGELMLSRDKGLSSLHQSDSDDVGPTTGIHRQITSLSRKSRQTNNLHGNFESDSFNENFSPVHPNTRRKRKFKRMAVDPVESDNPSTSRAAVPVFPLSTGKKKRIVRHSANCENKFNSLLCGKRKRSMRERSVDCERPPVSGPSMRSKSSRILAIHKLGLGNPDETRMDFESAAAVHCEMMSSSSLSSSESDTGIYTNDEGREGDDEQSDWWGGDAGSACSKSWWEDDDGEQRSLTPHGAADRISDVEESDPTFQAILSGSFEHMSEETKQAYRMHLQWIREGLNGREIRAGRRRIRGERPGFSIFTSANEKLSRFLQDPGQSELRLHPMQKQERDQLCHLANLYSLNMTSDPNRRTCPVLTKTSNTMQAVRVEQVRLTRLQARQHHILSDFKRRRKMPPGTGPTALTTSMSSHADAGGGSPIPENNIGNQMLRGMGWEPGTGLGAQSNGIQEPITTTLRPKYQGLGHNTSYKSS